MNGRIGVGIVGVGMWGVRVAAAVSRTETLKLISCYARSKDARTEAAARFHCKAAATLDELLDDSEISGVLVVTPNHAHCKIVTAAASRGKHVLVEKPIAESLSAASAMASACDTAGTTLFVAHCFRRLGAARTTAEVLKSGRLGKVVLAEATFALPGAFMPDSWRSSRRTLVGGPLTQLGIHHIDTLHSWFGPVDTVSGSLGHFSAPVDVDDVAIALLEHRCGTRSVVSCSYVSPKTYGFRLHGTEGRLDYKTDMSIWPQAERLDSVTSLSVEYRDGHQESIEFSSRDMIVDELEEFARCVQTGARPETGAAEGIAALEIVESAVRSNREGRRLALDGRRFDPFRGSAYIERNKLRTTEGPQQSRDE